MLRGAFSAAQVRRVMHGGYGAAVGEVASTTLFNGSSAAGAATADLLYLYPFRWWGGRPITGLFGRVTAAGTTSEIKFGLWRHNYTTSFPTGTPLLSNNTPLSTTTTGIRSAAVGPLDPPPGVYWVGSVQNGTTAGMQAITPANFEMATIVPIDAGFSLLRGAGNNGISGYSTPFTLTGNIGTLDLTAASFTLVGGNASVIPIVNISFG